MPIVSSCAHGRVLATSSFVSHARRAVATPQRMFCSVRSAVGVGVDHDPHARARGRTRVDVGQVAAVGVGVDLEHRARPRGGREDGVEVDRVRLAPLDQPARGVADGVHQGMLERGDHALGHRLLAHGEGRVHAGDHPVELAQQLVLVVERAVGQDVDLAAREQLDPLHARVGLAHELDLAAQLLRRDVVAEAVAGRVVGDRQVLVSAGARRQRHLLDRVVAVGGDRVAVQVAADVRQLDQPGNVPSRAAASSPRSSRSSGSI